MRWTSRGQIIHAEKSGLFAEVDRNRPPTAIKVATRAAARGGVPPPHTKCRFTAHTRAAGNSKCEPMEANMYEDALKAIEGMTKSVFHSKDEFTEWLAARNPKWVQFADRMWTELLVRNETAIAAIGEIRDGLLIDGVWVGEIGGVVKVYFALMDDGTEEIEDFAEHLVDLLAYLRECVDGDGRVLWDGTAPVVWRPATRAEYDSFTPPPPEHLLCGFDLPTVPGDLRIN